MARPLRIEYEGAWYHIMNRGAGKKKIYHSKSDYKIFLGVLNEITNRYQIQVHTYCLMPNHYHLLINTPLANLSRAMKHLNGVYAQHHNKSQKTDGPLFRGRFKSILIEENEYFLALSRYIHLNPVVAQIVKKPEQYEWSSYNAYLDLKKTPPWVITKYTFNKFGDKLQSKKYRTFVEEGISGCKKESDMFLKKVKRMPILGSETFIKTVTKKYLADPNSEILSNPAQKLLSPIRNTDFITKVVAEHYQIDICDIKIINHRKYGNQPRAIAIYLSCLLSNQKLREIGKEFSNISFHGISKTYRKMKDRLVEEAGLANEVKVIKDKIMMVK